MTLLLPAAALCAAIYLVLTARPASLPRSIVKTAAVALLAAAVWRSGGPPVLTLALALCALGDWLLSRETDAGFIAGIGAFATGHLAYVVLFLTDPRSHPAAIVTAPGLWATAALVVLGLAMAVVLAPRAGALKWPVLAYIPVILGMGLAAATLHRPGPLAAALAFIASDTILAAEKFLLPTPHPARRATPYAVWALYWGAQAGFVATFT